MKFLFDFFPVILFFAAFKIFGIYVATAFMMAASILQISINWWKHRRIETAHVLTLVAVLVLGTATLVLHDERFIKLKPTLAYGLTAIVFAGSHFVAGKKPLIQKLLGDQLILPSKIWTLLNIAWIAFFVVCGVLNLVIAHYFSLDAWVNFKLFGFLGITLVFAMAQGLVINKYAQKPLEKSEEKPEEKSIETHGSIQS